MTAELLIEDEGPPNLEDLLHQLGDIPPARILMKPAPGTATEEDALRLLDAPRKRICELVDGTLVEKAMSTWEGHLNLEIVQHLGPFVKKCKLGKLFGADAMMRLFPDQVRIPDISFVTHERLRGHKPFAVRVDSLIPDLAIEILSESNTPGEMKRKLKDYFLAGVRLVWIIDPVKRCTAVYTQPDKHKKVRADKPLSGGDVLPGYELVLQELFDELA